MDNLPDELLESIFFHLEAFGAHCLGKTCRRARASIARQRTQALQRIESRVLLPEPTIYDQWFCELLSHVEALAKNEARDGLNLDEYAPSAVAALTDVCIDQDELWQIFTDTHEEEVTLCDFVTFQVEATTFRFESELFHCDACGLINVKSNGGYMQCLEC